MMLSQKLNSQRIFKRLAKALIRLRLCAGWSEPLLVAHTTLLEISCRGSFEEFLPRWLSVHLGDTSNSESPCYPDAYHQVWVESGMVQERLPFFISARAEQFQQL